MIEQDAPAGPVFAQQSRLGLAHGRQFVVVLFEKRSLPVTHQKKTAHERPGYSVRKQKTISQKGNQPRIYANEKTKKQPLIFADEPNRRRKSPHLTEEVRAQTK